MASLDTGKCGICGCSLFVCYGNHEEAWTYPNWVEVGNEGEEWNINWDQELKDLVAEGE